MWNKRRDEEPPKPFVPPASHPAGPLATPPAPGLSESKKEAAPVSSTPSARVDAESRGTASIGKAVKIVGQIFSKEDLYVDGDLEGTVELLEHKLTVGPNGNIHAGVKAREVVALGTIQGNVDAADKIEIRKDARLIGDIRTARIIIEDGAYFKGSIDIIKAEAPRSAPKPQVSAPAAAPPPPAAAPAEVKR